MNAFVSQLARQSLTGGWMILALVLLRPLIKKLPRWISCLLWALAAVRLVLPFTLESRMSLVPQRIAAPVHITPIAPIMTSLPATQTAAPVAAAEFSWQSLLPVLWLLGAAAMAIYACVSCIRILRQVQVSIRVGKRVYLCDEVKSPFILGIFRPRIYLPSDLKQPMVDYVLSHEQAHLRRGDHLWKPLGYAILSIYWFNPLCWLAYLLFCRDIEQACDEAVIRDMSPHAKKAYSAALLECSLPGHAIAACPLAFGEVGVKQRIQGILNYRKPKFWVLLLSVLLCTVLAVGFLTDPAKANQAEAPQNSGEIQATTFDGKGEARSFTQDTTIYTSPSLQSKELAQAEAGEAYYILRLEPIAGNNWGYVECREGTILGWVLLEESEKPLQLPGISVYRNPDEASVVVCTLTPGEDYRILERNAIDNRIWAEVECKEGTVRGWIVLMEGPATAEFLSGVVTADRLNVRSGPGASYSAVGYLEGGTEVIILEVMSFDGQQWGYLGPDTWVNMNYIQCQEDGQVPETTDLPIHEAPTGTPGETITPKEPLEIHGSPSDQSRVIGQTGQGETCTITRREFIADGSWAYLTCPDSNLMGWVHFEEEDEALNYFREYVEACSQPRTELVEPYLYFSSDYAREFFRIMYRPVTGWYPSGMFRVNDNLWGIQYSDSASGRMVYSFVGRMDGRLYVFQNVHQVPEALSENLDVKAYEEENAMYLSEDYMESDYVIRRLLPFAQAKYVTISGLKDYSSATPCPIEDVICGTDTWQEVEAPSSYGSPGCTIWLTAADGSVAMICDSSPVIVVSCKDGPQQYFQAAYTGEELVGMIYSWAYELASAGYQ